MRTDPELQLDNDAGDTPTSLAGYLLTAERIVMGFVLLGFGVSGLMNFVPDGWLPPRVEAIDGALMQVGFAYPLLKGIEVLLEQYIGRKARTKAQRVNLVAQDSRTLPVARGATVRAYRTTRRRTSARGASHGIVNAQSATRYQFSANGRASTSNDQAEGGCLTR